MHFWHRTGRDKPSSQFPFQLTELGQLAAGSPLRTRMLGKLAIEPKSAPALIKTFFLPTLVCNHVAQTTSFNGGLIILMAASLI